MKILFKYLIIFVLASILFNCSSEDVGTIQEASKGNFNEVVVKINIPENSKITLENTSVSTMFFDAPVEVGTSKIPFNTESPELAFLMDSEDNVLLSGFITGNDSELSIESTAEVLLYFGLGATFLPYEIKEKYISEVKGLKSVSELSKYLETLSSQDELFLEKALFSGKLSEEISKLKKIDSVNIFNKSIDS